uniref:Uncharacterized protein n=1 Tax=Aegilops tauschii subsp. strangulata TaxID=200361 RepID=A0A453MJC8_AEGTS
AKLRPIHQPIGRSARILVPSLSPRAFSWISDHSRISISLSVRYHANRMLSFYAPGWCGEVRDVIYNDNGKVTVVYRVTIRGIDGEVRSSGGCWNSITERRTARRPRGGRGRGGVLQGLREVRLRAVPVPRRRGAVKDVIISCLTLSMFRRSDAKLGRACM